MCSPFWLIMNEFMRQWAQPQMRVHKFACQESEFHFITECTGKNYRTDIYEGNCQENLKTSEYKFAIVPIKIIFITI